MPNPKAFAPSANSNTTWVMESANQFKLNAETSTTTKIFVKAAIADTISIWMQFAKEPTICAYQAIEKETVWLASMITD